MFLALIAPLLFSIPPLSLLHHLIFFPLRSPFSHQFSTAFENQLLLVSTLRWAQSVLDAILFPSHHPDKWAVLSQNFTKHKSMCSASLSGFLLTVLVNVSDHLEPPAQRFQISKSWSCEETQKEEPAGSACWVPVARKTKTEALMSPVWPAEAAGVTFSLMHHKLNVLYCGGMKIGM